MHAYAQVHILVWFNEFDKGGIDTSKWSFKLGKRFLNDLVDRGNSEQQYYTDRKKSILINDDILHIIALEESDFKNYTSARSRNGCAWARNTHITYNE